MMKFLLFILISVTISLIADVIAWKISSNRWKTWLIVVGLGIFMTATSVGSLQQKSFLFEEEATVLKTVSDLRSMESDSLRKRRLSAFLDSNFTLVNTSNDPQLYAVGDGDDIITDRRKLQQLLSFLCSRESMLDLVVVDVRFIHSTPDDSALRAAFNCLGNKLVLSYKKGRDTKNSYFYANVDPSSFGDVALDPDEPFYYTDDLFNEDQYPSLSYLMYKKMNKVSVPDPGDWLLKEFQEGKTYYAFRNFIPDLHFIKETELYKNQISGGAVGNADAPNGAIVATGPSLIEDLGYWVTGPGEEVLNDRLSHNMKHGHNIVFIGSFLSRFEDTHPTAYGNLHGTTLLLNEYYEFSKGRHHFTIWQLIGYGLTLLAGFSGIVWFLIHRSEKKSRRIASPPEVISRNGVIRYFKTFFVFVLDELHYFLLLLFAIVVAFFWGKVLNLLAITYYLVIFEAFLQLGFRYYLNRVNSNGLRPDSGGVAERGVVHAVDSL